MKIGVIGAGNIGGGLGAAWEKKGHAVTYATRDAAGQRAAVEGAEVVVLAIPWKAVPEVIPPLASALAGKVLVDCTNAVGWDDGPVIGVDTSAAQKIAELAPGARVTKAFNTLGAEHLATATVHGQFLFNQSTDQLWWDPDGLGKQAAVLIATFQNGAHVTAADFDLLT